MNKLILDRISIALIILVMILLVSAFFYLKSEGKQCLSNPYIYGAGKMGNVSCSCIQFNNPICPAKFSFNDATFSAGITKCGSDGTDIPKSMYLDVSQFTDEEKDQLATFN